MSTAAERHQQLRMVEDRRDAVVAASNAYVDAMLRWAQLHRMGIVHEAADLVARHAIIAAESHRDAVVAQANDAATVILRGTP